MFFFLSSVIAKVQIIRNEWVCDYIKSLNKSNHDPLDVHYFLHSFNFFPKQYSTPEPSFSVSFDSMSFVNPFRGEVAWHLTIVIPYTFIYLAGAIRSEKLLLLTSCVTEPCYYSVLVLNPSSCNWIITRALITKIRNKKNCRWAVRTWRSF